MMTVARATLRTILNSAGQPAVEAELTSTCGATAVASGPSAIAAGGRERPTGTGAGWSPSWALPYETALMAELDGRDLSQAAWDRILTTGCGFGTQLSVPLSVAHARLQAMRSGEALAVHLARLAGQTRISGTGPAYLVALISGGIHGQARGPAAQQVMGVVSGGDILDRTRRAVELHHSVRQRLDDLGLAVGIGPSSGFVAEIATTQHALEIVARSATAFDSTSIAVDVAAEHLWNGRSYDVDGAEHDPARMADEIRTWIGSSPITYLEDPFHPDHRDEWRDLTGASSQETTIVGDDLFATDAAALDRELASGVVIKINQIGTVTGTIETMQRAQQLGLTTCVSHRSTETEDPFICHLAVGCNADHIKLGGPLRGDRTARYNELLRLSCHLGEDLR